MMGRATFGLGVGVGAGGGGVGPGGRGDGLGFGPSDPPPRPPSLPPSDADVVSVDLSSNPPGRPLGMLLAPGAGEHAAHSPGSGSAFHAEPTDSRVVLVAGWEHDDGEYSATGGGGRRRQLGPVQRCGAVRLGDRLVRINGRDVTDWTFREVMDALKELVSSPPAANGAGGGGKRPPRLRTLGFAPAGSAEWVRGTRAAHGAGGDDAGQASGLSSFLGMLHAPFQSQPGVAAGQVVHVKRRYSFASFVGGWRVAKPGSSAVHPAVSRSDADKRRGSEDSRQFSDGTIGDLERQLNKQPSITYHDDDDPLEGRNPSSSPPPSKEVDASTTEKPFVEYEIRCHILFRDSSSFRSDSYYTARTHAEGLTGGKANGETLAHSWSVWRRYSDLAALDDALRREHGWRMDALDDGRGVDFPGSRGVESWWYGVRNAGGTLTGLLGGNTGVGEGSGDGRGVDGGEEAKGDESKGGKGDASDEKGSSGSGGGLLGWFLSSSGGSDGGSAGAGTTAITSNQNGVQNGDHNGDADADAKENNNVAGGCPFPVSFIESRRDELASYWTKLMRIDDIFEFGDVHSHRFGKVMANFLEMEDVLSGGGAARSSPQRPQHQQQQQQLHPQHKHHEPLPGMNAIREEEGAEGQAPSGGSQLFDSTSSAEAVRESSGQGCVHDDDVSVLTEGTGAVGTAGGSLLSRGRPGGVGGPVVDVLPGGLPPGLGGGGGGSAAAAEGGQRAPSSASAKSGGGPRREKGAPRARPAFQRQFRTT
ncbi:hypothetical protein ACHAWF_016953 [Thalassiosira exigua]